MTATRADVAKLAGVSPSVVSYVTSPGTRPVAPATRERVLAAIEELGYRPNLIAQALRAGPTRSVGLIIPDHSNLFFGELAQEIGSLLFERGIVMSIGSTEEDEDREQRYLQSFVDRRVDGLICVVPVNDGNLSDIMGETPVVLMDRVPKDQSLPTVRTDHNQGARMGVEHLISLGHTCVGMIAGPEHLSVSDERRSGWKQALEAAGITPEENQVARAPFTRAGGYEAARKLLSNQHCTALLASSDTQAIGALKYAADAGLRVPEDVSIVTIDGTDLAKYSVPELTRITQPTADLAKAAVETLMAKMECAQSGDGGEVPVPEPFEPRLEIGASTAPSNPRA